MNINVKQEVIFDAQDDNPNEKILRIIHFNDVYNIQPSQKNPIGGASRFQTLLNYLNKEHFSAITLFGGDAFSPSLSKLLIQEIMISVFITDLFIQKTNYLILSFLLCSRKANGRRAQQDEYPRRCVSYNIFKNLIAKIIIFVLV
jgi:hypothetical protein